MCSAENLRFSDYNSAHAFSTKKKTLSFDHSDTLTHFLVRQQETNNILCQLMVSSIKRAQFGF